MTIREGKRVSLDPIHRSKFMFLSGMPRTVALGLCDYVSRMLIRVEEGNNGGGGDD